MANIILPSARVQQPTGIPELRSEFAELFTSLTLPGDTLAAGYDLAFNTRKPFSSSGTIANNTPTPFGKAVTGDGSTGVLSRSISVTPQAMWMVVSFIPTAINTTQKAAYALGSSAASNGAYIAISSGVGSVSNISAQFRGVDSGTAISKLGPVPVAGQQTTVVFVCPSTLNADARVYVNGVSYNSDATGAGNTTFTTTLVNEAIAALKRGTTAIYSPDKILLAGYGFGVLPVTQARELSRNPWQIFTPQKRVIYFDLAAAGGAYTLLGDASSYLLSGQDSGLYVGRLLSAQEAAFSVSGQDAGTYLDRVLAAQDSSFVLSGRDADLLAARALPGQTSEFLLSGQDASLLSGRVLAGQANPFAVSGQAASLLRGYTLSAGQAAYLLSGQDANLVHTVAGAYVLTANKGDFSLQGQDAMLLLSRVLTGNAGGFSVTGVSADMLRGLSLLADAAAYIASGGSANLVYTGGYSLICGGATFSVSPQDAQLLLGRVLQAAGQGFTLTGRDAQFISGVAEAVMIGDIQWRVAIQRPDNRTVIGRPDNRVIIN